MPEPAKVKASVGTSITFSDSGAASKESAAPVEVPKDVQWGDVKTLVQAKPSAQIRNTGSKVVATFITKVTSVKDGDTVVTSKKQSDGTSVECRLDASDAPETGKPWKKNADARAGQPYADQSTKTLRQLIENKEVTVRFVEDTRTGQPKMSGKRHICQIEIEGKDVDLTMVKGGDSFLYTRFVSSPAFLAAEADAKKNKRGIYGISPNPENPELFRRRTKDPGERF